MAAAAELRCVLFRSGLPLGSIWSDRFRADDGLEVDVNVSVSVVSLGEDSDSLCLLLVCLVMSSCELPGLPCVS